MDAEKILTNIENMYTMNLSAPGGKVERARQQHIGKLYNQELPIMGHTYDTMLANIDRLLSGKHRHGFEQNKKTDKEKLIEKGMEILNGN